MQRFVKGQSIREISREEGKARETVTKIARSDEMNAFVCQMREHFYGLGVDALDAVRHSLSQKKDGQLGYRLLSDIEVIPTQNEFQSSLPILPEKRREERVMELGLRLLTAASERAQHFGMPDKQLKGALKQVRRQIGLLRGTAIRFLESNVQKSDGDSRIEELT